MEVIAKQTVLKLYKRLMRQATLIEDKNLKEKYLCGLRGGFKDKAKETDSENIRNLIVGAESRLSFLKTITPRRSDENSGRTTFIFRDGKAVEGTAKKKGLRDSVDKRLASDDLDRHKQLLRRQHFMDRD